jgi:type IV pilus assembly protein PilO
MAKEAKASSGFAAFSDKVAQMSKVQRILVFVLAIVVIAGGLGFPLVYQNLQTASELKLKLKESQDRLEAAKQEAKDNEAVKKEYDQKQRDFEDAKHALPEKAEIPGLLEGVATAGRQAGIQFTQFNPKEETGKDFFAEIPVDLAFNGSYHAMGQFFANVANLSRIVNIKNLKIAPGRDATGPTWRVLVASCQAVTYRVLETPPEKPNAPAATPTSPK